MSSVRNFTVQVHTAAAFIAFADFEQSSASGTPQSDERRDHLPASDRVVAHSSLKDQAPEAVLENDIGASTVRRLEFVAAQEDLPFFLAPLIAQHVWSQENSANLIFAYPGVSDDRLTTAAEALASGAEAVLLRDEAENSIVLGLAHNSRNRRLVVHWADSVDSFSRAPDAQTNFGSSFGGLAASFLCDRVCSLRAPSGWSISRKDSTPGTARKRGKELIHAAVRKLMSFSEALLTNPTGNAALALNEPDNTVQQDSGRLITKLMVFVREQRRDLEDAFDLTSERGRDGFVEWFIAKAAMEFDLAQEFIDPVRAARLSTADTDENELAQSSASRLDENDSSFGCNLIGYPRAEMGMGEQMRSCARSLEAVDSEIHMVDFNFGITASQADHSYDHLLRLNNPSPVNLFHVNADQIPLALEKLGESFFRDKYNVAYWEWELSEFPRQWMSSLDWMDEVWAPSTFIETAVSKRTTKPVIWMPLAVECDIPAEDIATARAKFGLPVDSFLFLFSFDFSSFATRKNFKAALDAFRRAFPEDQNVGLVLKTIRHARHQREFWEMLREVADDERIFIIDRVLRQHEMRALTACCDSFLSLHRSEGFGLGIAEAMYLGKPVVVTNYSGNTDFTLPDNSCLVDYKLIPVKEGEYLFPEGQVWADPDIDHAASYMQRLFADREYGAKLGRAAAAFMRKQHSFKAVGDRYLKRLEQIGRAREILSPSQDDNEGLVRNIVKRLRKFGVA